MIRCSYSDHTLRLISPCTGPFVVRSRPSPVIYRVSKGEQPEQMSVHLARIKPSFAPSAGSALGFVTLDGFFLGTKIPLPGFDNVASQVRIGNIIVNAIEKHKRAPGKPSLTNFQYFFTFRGYPPGQGAWRDGNTVPQCLKLINAYRARLFAHDSRAFEPPPPPPPLTIVGPHLLNRPGRPFPRLRPERNFLFFLFFFCFLS